jgi:hypothetical protein
MKLAWPQLMGVGRIADVEHLAQAARYAAGCPDGPLLLRQACEAATVRVRPDSLDVGRRRHTAMLVPTAEGFQVVIDRVLWEQAKREQGGRHHLRFVLAHELGHTLFYRPGRPPTRTRPADRSEERFCQRFAGELQVPRAAARDAALTPNGLHALAGEHDVSRRVAAWAIARARPEVTMLWLRRAAHPTRGDQETMRVQWGASHRFVAPGESFKSTLARLAPGEHGEAVEDLRLAGRRERVHVKAWRFASAMLAVIFPSAVHAEAEARREQLPLF